MLCNQVGLLLHYSGTPRHILQLLHHMGLCCANWEISSAIKEISRDATSQLAAIGQRPNVITAYNNLDYTVGRQKLSDGKGSLRTVTTGVAFEGQCFPAKGLAQSMLNPDFELTVPMFDISAFVDDEIDFQFSKFAVYETLRMVFPENIQRIYARNQVAAPSFPVIDRLAPFRTKFHPFLMDIDESTLAGNIDVLEEISSRQYRWDETHNFAERLHLFYGDQRTVSRLRLAKLVRCESRAVYDRFGWVLPVPGLFHLKMQWLKMIHELHYMAKHYDSPSSLAFFREILDQNRVQTDNADFFALEELVLHCFHGKILTAVFDKLRNTYTWLNLLKVGKPEEWEKLFEELGLEDLESCINNVVQDTLHGELDPDEMHPEFLNNIHFLRLARGSLMLKMGVRYGDLGWVRRAIGHSILFFTGWGRSFACEMLDFWRLISTDAADPVLQRAILANSLVNCRRKNDTFFETDRLIAIVNGKLKRVLLNKRHDSSISIEELQHIIHSFTASEDLRTSLAETFNLQTDAPSPAESVSRNIRLVADYVYSTMIEDCPLPEDLPRVRVLASEAIEHLPETIERVNQGEFENEDEYGNMTESDEDEIDRFFGSAVEDDIESAVEGLL